MSELEGDVFCEPTLQVHDYLQVLKGIELSEYERVQGITDDVFVDNSGPSKSYECHTANTIFALQAFDKEPTRENFDNVISWRLNSAVHVVRGMVQLEKFPTQQFGIVIHDVLGTLATIDGNPEPTRKHVALLRNEVNDVLTGTPTRAKRATPTDRLVVYRAQEAKRFVRSYRTFLRQVGTYPLNSAADTV